MKKLLLLLVGCLSFGIQSSEPISKNIASFTSKNLFLLLNNEFKLFTVGIFEAMSHLKNFPAEFMAKYLVRQLQVTLHFSELLNQEECKRYTNYEKQIEKNFQLIGIKKTIKLRKILTDFYKINILEQDEPEFVAANGSLLNHAHILTIDEKNKMLKNNFPLSKKTRDKLETFNEMIEKYKKTALTPKIIAPIFFTEPEIFEFYKKVFKAFKNQVQFFEPELSSFSGYRDEFATAFCQTVGTVVEDNGLSQKKALIELENLIDECNAYLSFPKLYFDEISKEKKLLHQLLKQKKFDNELVKKSSQLPRFLIEKKFPNLAQEMGIPFNFRLLLPFFKLYNIILTTLEKIINKKVSKLKNQQIITEKFNELMREPAPVEDNKLISPGKLVRSKIAKECSNKKKDLQIQPAPHIPAPIAPSNFKVSLDKECIISKDSLNQLLKAQFEKTKILNDRYIAFFRKRNDKKGLFVFDSKHELFDLVPKKSPTISLNLLEKYKSKSINKQDPRHFSIRQAVLTNETYFNQGIFFDSNDNNAAYSKICTRYNIYRNKNAPRIIGIFPGYFAEDEHAASIFKKLKEQNNSKISQLLTGLTAGCGNILIEKQPNDYHVRHCFFEKEVTSLNNPS